MRTDVIQGEIMRWAEAYQGPKFHALLSDAPYHLTETVKRFGKPGSAPAKPGRDGAFARISRGFMGQIWDGGDIAFRSGTWSALAEHLLPGAFGMVFGAANRYHRLACAIEDAGLIIHPMIGWVYGQGLQKSTRIDTQVDQKAGAVRKVAGVRDPRGMYDGRVRTSPAINTEWRAREGRRDVRDMSAQVVTMPATSLAKTWAGHRYGQQALKPAIEPICVFQKPYDGAPLDCITATGAGALNIDDSRVEGDAGSGVWGSSNQTCQAGRVFNCSPGGEEYRSQRHPGGRWPANLILDDSDDVIAMLPDNAGAAAPVSSGQSGKKKGIYNDYASNGDDGATFYGERGSAANFFFTVDDTLEKADPIYYCAKVSRSERSAGLNVRNPHPALKPIKLTRYLATLLSPPGAYAPRRIMVPFAGVGSEMIGAMLAGWEVVQGIEWSPEYCRVAVARLRHWAGREQRENVTWELME